jgi:hypothetical protein
LYATYEDDSGLDVVSPGARVELDVFERITLGLKYIYERFEKSAPEDVVDAVSGATTVSGGSGTGFKETRREYGASGAVRLDAATLSAGYVYSDESDFASNTASLGVSREMLDKNLTVAALASFGVDDVEIAAEEHKHKYTKAVTVAATQLLSPTALLVGGYSFARVDGYQENPLRKIRVDLGFGLYTNHDESHPDVRNRHTLFVRGKKYFTTGTAFDLNLARYQDDWGVSANSAELRVSQYVTKFWIVRLRYRLYAQSNADFYQTIYPAVEDEMTADTRLREFDSHLAGVKLTWYPAFFAPRKVSIAAGYDRYRETNDGLSADIAQFSVMIPI